ncbi:MAG: hypothetical protein SGBAC_012880 [Bacillariaceae sp.]
MEEFQGWTSPAGGQSNQNGFSNPPVLPPTTAYHGYDAPTTLANHYYNVQYSPRPNEQRVNVYEVSPPRPTYGTSNPTSVSPDRSYGYPYQNAYGGPHNVSTPPRDQPPTQFNATPRNIDNTYYPSPPMSQGSWNVPSPESATSTKTTVEGEYGKTYHATAPPRNISQVSISPNERPITRPTVAVSRGHEGIPAFPIPQQQQKYHRVADIRQESKNREKKEHLMLRPGIRRLPHMSLEKMATSTRVQKPKLPVPNHQTINAFKFKLHHDRETIARSKALSLMDMHM